MAAADADVQALTAACGEIVTLADAAVAAAAAAQASSDGYIHITKDADASAVDAANAALTVAAAALPALVTAADAAVEALEE